MQTPPLQIDFPVTYVTPFLGFEFLLPSNSAVSHTKGPADD
jgi:hypothetical protein